MIEITIHCDHADQPRAREGKPSNYCWTAAGGAVDHTTGLDRNMDTAAAKARTAARNAGWKQTKINRNGARGWLCPPCYARAYPEKVTDED